MCSALDVLGKLQWPQGVSQSHAEWQRKKLKSRRDQATCSSSYTGGLLPGLGFRLKSPHPRSFSEHPTLAFQGWSKAHLPAKKSSLIGKSSHPSGMWQIKPCTSYLSPQTTFQSHLPQISIISRWGAFQVNSTPHSVESWHQNWACGRCQIWIDKNDCGWLRLSGSDFIFLWLLEMNLVMKPSAFPDAGEGHSVKVLCLAHCLFSLGNLSQPSLSCVKEIYLNM